MAAFTELQTSWPPPPVPELDNILARVLSDRFGLLPPEQHDQGAMVSRVGGQALRLAGLALESRDPEEGGYARQ